MSQQHGLVIDIDNGLWIVSLKDNNFNTIAHVNNNVHISLNCFDVWLVIIGTMKMKKITSLLLVGS